MELTLEDLAALDIPEESAALILAACEAARSADREQLAQAAQTQAALTARLDGLIGERDALTAQVAEMLRAREEAERTARSVQRREAVTQALLRRGANERALPLMLDALGAEALTACETAEAAERLAETSAAAYPDLFAQPVRIPLETLAPPVAQLKNTITAREIGAMTTEEINRNWNAVKSALTKGERI